MASPLSADTLRPRTDLSHLKFTTTADVTADIDVLGQDRAFEAVRFGIGMKSKGYNLFVLGPTGAGKHRFVAKIVGEQAATEKQPPDWCYVHNFDDPHRPIALSFTCGHGRRFRRDMQQLVEDLKTALPTIFESEDYRNRRQLIDQEFRDRQDKVFEDIQEKATPQHITLVRTPTGLALVPVKDGEVVSPQDFQKLPDEDKKKLQEAIEALQMEMAANLQNLPRWDKERRERLRELNREVTTFTVSPHIVALRAAYMDFPEVVSYLDAVEKDIIDNSIALFLQDEADAQSQLPGQQQPGEHPVPEGRARRRLSFRRYEVNLFVDNEADRSGAPVVHEDHPTHPNLIGRIEQQAELGTLLTDFTLLRPGALHRANGGYLLLDARKVLLAPAAWEELKRVLFSREIRIESLTQSYFGTVTLDPEPIPLDVKVVLFGDRQLYYMLAQGDPEFDELFKVAADFEDEVPRDRATVERYVALVAAQVRRNKLAPFDRGAVERVIDHSARMVSDAEKLSARVGPVTDLLQEASHIAETQRHDIVQAEDVEAAIAGRERRADRIRTLSLESIARQIVLIDTDGSKVGQINGLSVLSIGSTAFGRPTRISARVRMGRGEVIDVEREVHLGGPTHSKGVLILSSYLGAHYAADRPLSLSASLVFEQSYGGVDGDSASSTELYAILSALSDAPIHQGFAVTGSVNQYGEVQAIGGVNEKIEGFFDVCRGRGLTGKQGVLIPVSNVKHLMLRHDVVEACRAGQFAIYPITTIDEGISLLTGVPAGTRAADGSYPEGTINRRVDDRLQAFAEARRKFGAEVRDSRAG